MAAKIDHLAVEIEVDHLGRRIGREIQDQRLGRRHRLFDAAFQAVEEIVIRSDGDVMDVGPGDDEAVGVDRVARVGRQHHVARRGDRLGEIGQPLLRPQGDDVLGVGIDADVEAPFVIGRMGPAQTGNAARVRIAVGAPVARHLDQLFDDMLRRRLVRIAHAEIDDVLAGRAGARLHRVDFGEHIGRQTLYPMKLFFHRIDPGHSLPRDWGTSMAAMVYPLKG